MSSINTNRSALLALQAVTAASKDLAATQTRVSTGFKVAGPKDNSAIYAIAQGMRAEVGGWVAAAQSLGRIQSALNVSSAAASSINDVLVEIREKIAAYADASQSAGNISLLRQDIEGLIRQITQQATLADFDGLNFVNGTGTPGVVLRVPTTGYNLATSPLTPQSFNTVMSAGATNSAVTASMSTKYDFNLPYSPLTPDSFAAFAPRAVSSGTSVIPTGNVRASPTTSLFKPNVYGEHPFGDQPTRVAFEFDMLVDPDLVEVWQNGTRVAATGQSQAMGGVAVGPGTPLSGRQIVSFDYLPSRGTDVEVRVSGASGSTFIDYRWTQATVGSVAPPPTSTMSRSVESTPQTNPLPATPLTIETSGLPATNGNPLPLTVNGGPNSGRVDLLFDASITPDVVEIWQGVNRVAASGQPYVGGGAVVGAGVPTSGPQVISFDYDPNDGQSLEFRFNENNGHSGAAWVVGGLVLQPTSSPLPTLPLTPTISQSVYVGVTDDAEFLGPSAPPLTPETYAEASASKTYVIDGGTNAGRIDVAFDAYDDPDVMEVWQGTALLASTGPVTGMLPTPLSFDYIPNGQLLEFRFNPGNPAPGAWTVGGIAFNPVGSPLVSPTISGGPTTGAVSGTIYTKITPIQSADGSELDVDTRNLSAVGLGLDALDWTDPAAMLVAVNRAIGVAIQAATYFGSQETLIESLLLQNGKLRDKLNSGIGNLVDADLAKDSAKLQAQQIRQQLATQTLGIANREPQWLLGLFR